MPGDDTRKLLRQAMEERLVPAIKQLGFEQLPLGEEDRKSPEMRTAFPFGAFRRIKGSEYHIIQIQMDKRKPQFFLNFAIIPPEGTDVPWRHFAQDEAPIESSPDAYRLYPSRNPGPLSPSFGVSAIGLPLDPAARARKAVEEAVALLTEVEEFFATRKVGPHMRRHGYASLTAGKSS